MATLDNLHPEVYGIASHRSDSITDYDDSVPDPIDARELFDLIRDIQDPEHPLTLEQLNVVRSLWRFDVVAMLNLYLSPVP